ncbi:ABC transporter ATP-binding protein [Thiohalophilus sp.]|uniref:ABC transporter ATP-binding protein n=1 Tax=Thiohalophilus sp. TaxID=3028392 RepID=UPI002ACD4CC1|nr:ABC transporter ATP-binding protein [Thiohalophilus sp.]MDZ7662074.1 ABC transporter ATP-binding protein [Thiohalophilus sp.]
MPPSVETDASPIPADEPISSTPPRGYGWPYLFTEVLRHKRELIKANIIAVLAVMASVPIPLMMPLLVDEVLLEQPGPLVGAMQQWFPPGWHGPVLYILFILLVTVMLRLGSIMLTVWQTRQFTLVAKDVVYRMRRVLLQRLQRISMAEYETLGSGTVSSHFVTDLNAIDEFIGQSVSKTLIAGLSLIGVTVVLLWLHWQLALFILFLNPLVIYFTVTLGKKVKNLKKHENKAFEVFQESLVETLDAIRQLRASNRERHYLGRVIDAARGVKNHSANYSWKSDAASRLSFGVFLLGFDTFRATGMLMVVFSDLSIGQMMAVFGYLWFMMTPVQELLNLQYAFYAAKAALTRVNSLLDLRLEPRYPHHENPFRDKATTGIRLDDINFAYGDNEPVLRHVSLDIKPGEKVALVGASGGGKSTLVQVVLGIYPFDSGMLYFDGVPITRIGLDVVRENVVTVLQHPAMFNDTVRHNLTLGESLNDEQLWQALGIAQLAETVAQLPRQLDTLIGRQGVRLSGGQQQRLAIARMILADPKIVILDEATSALDTETEARVHRALHDTLRDRTTLIIAHRLSAVRQADRVYVFEDGHIIEHGSHDELIEAGGLYQRLYGKQA